jgi:hypothetical protein
MAARVGLGHLLDDFEDSRRPSSLSPRFRRVFVDGWMWRPAEAETIFRQAPRAKVGREPGPEWAGPVGPGQPTQAHFGSVQPRFAPRLLLAWSLICVHLHVGLWRRFLHGLGLNPCHASFTVLNIYEHVLNLDENSSSPFRILEVLMILISAFITNSWEWFTMPAK